MLKAIQINFNEKIVVEFISGPAACLALNSTTVIMLLKVGSVLTFIFWEIVELLI
jgi:hypothetical protein